MFIIFTILGPVMMAAFTVLPALIFTIKTGDATRIAIVDQSGRMFARVSESIMADRGRDEEFKDAESPVTQLQQTPNERMQNTSKSILGSFRVETVPLNGRPIVDVKKDLADRVQQNQLDAYIVIPEDLNNGKFELFSRNVSDMITREQLKDRLNDAVRDQRLADANISRDQMRLINKPIDLSIQKAGAAAGEQDSGASFWMVFIIGFLIYITLIMYGQVILGAVVEEKETRIAEMLFSSARSFQLMMGKLIGVSLVALTQYAIWGLFVLAFVIYGVGMLSARGINVSLPHIAPSVVFFMLMFFLVGYFVYSTIYALVGSMVTTTQEGGQVAMPIIFLLVIAFYLSFPVIRSPNSSFSFWISMVPFFSPITMPVRIITQTPPLWQIGLSLLIGVVTVVFLIWLASRIYRIGMLMYGKRASIPEVLRWVRQT